VIERAGMEKGDLRRVLEDLNAGDVLEECRRRGLVE